LPHKIEDFEGPSVDANHKVKGIGGAVLANVKQGTSKLWWS